MDVLRVENVGSLLRPPGLLAARERFAAGELPAAALARVEDEAVDAAVALQDACGIDVVTDGELRRNVFASGLAQSVDGFDRVEGNTVDWFRLDGTRDTSPVTVAVTSRLRRRRSLLTEELAYLRARTRKPIKATIPSPSMYAYYWLPGVSEAAYPTPWAYLEDVTALLREEAEEAVRQGCDYLQVDAPELGMLIDPHQRAWFEAKGFDPDRLVREGVDMIDAVVEGLPVRTGLHLCRGNDANRFMARGGYGAIAAEVLARTTCQILLLEYDDDRSGGFEPLDLVRDDAVVVLGLVTTKRAELEQPERLRERIAEAARHVPLERLALSTQCGFASVAKGNHLSPEAQEAKLRLVASVAASVWG